MGRYKYILSDDVQDYIIAKFKKESIKKIAKKFNVPLVPCVELRDQLMKKEGIEYIYFKKGGKVIIKKSDKKPIVRPPAIYSNPQYV